MFSQGMCAAASPLLRLTDRAAAGAAHSQLSDGEPVAAADAPAEGAGNPEKGPSVARALSAGGNARNAEPAPAAPGRYASVETPPPSDGDCAAAAAADKPEAGGGTAAPPLSPHSLLGRTVRREFAPHGWFTGRVTNTRHHGKHGQLWLVKYNDGDKEELSWEDLHGCLLPGSAAAAAPAASGEEHAEEERQLLPPQQQPRGHTLEGLRVHVPHEAPGFASRTGVVGSRMPKTQLYRVRLDDGQVLKRVHVTQLRSWLHDAGTEAGAGAAVMPAAMPRHATRAPRRILPAEGGPGAGGAEIAQPKPQPPRKRSSEQVAQVQRKRARTAAAAAGRSMPSAEELGRVEAFRRSISPPLSQARLCHMLVVSPSAQDVLLSDSRACAAAPSSSCTPRSPRCRRAASRWRTCWRASPWTPPTVSCA
jgi:hypothetical protein